MTRPHDRLDINAATPDEIDAVPALAGHGFEIVRYRGERGGFTELRQLWEVPGLSGTTEDLAAILTLGAAGS